MRGLAFRESLKRVIRSDDWERLGIPTHKLIMEAMENGRMQDAAELLEYLGMEGKSLHDLYCDWIWDMLTKVAQVYGEEKVYWVCRETQGTWMLKRTWKAMVRMPVEDRVFITAEILRSHRCGPLQDGSLEVRDEGIRISLKMDPCGSGGRMRRGDPIAGTPSRLGPPYNFGVTQKAYPWSWGMVGVPYYCVHCAVNEILPTEWGGYPLWVTGFSLDAEDPCYWFFYKRPEDIPDCFFERIGFSKKERSLIWTRIPKN
ncbi:MAG: hypothetical protein QXS68_04485 [Candidatus Methanomethylicaceae archaeon]